MAKLNILKLESSCAGADARGRPREGNYAEQALRRSVLACMLWEDEFYEDGVADRRPHS